MELARVKRELRELKRLGNAIDAGVRAEVRLRAWGSVGAEIRSFNDRYVKRASRLAVKYIDAIGRLDDPIDRTIATEAFINGKTYSEIGRCVCLCEASIKYRVERIYRKIVCILK